jgi:hypothetical protein
MDNYDTYKVIRNKVRKYVPSSIITKCIDKLHEIYKKPIHENVGYLPWEILLLIKIAFIEDGNGSHDKIATDNDIALTINVIKDESKHNKFLRTTSPHGIYKFLRMTAFQQFWLQDKTSGFDIGRQLVLFDDDDWGYPIRERFLSLTGLEISVYFELLITTWTAFEVDNNRKFIEPKWFGLIEKHYGAAVIRTYLSNISLSYQDTKEYLLNVFNESKDFHEQFYEKTPLVKYPILNINDKYICYSPHVLSEKIKDFLYDTLKTNDPSEFPREFGIKFEKYIRKCLDYASIKYFGEIDLGYMFPDTKKCDFIIINDRCTVLLEVKGIEMSPVIRVNPTDEILSSLLKNSVIKAIKQIYSTVNNLNSEKGKGIVNSGNLYAIILTYKELYLGTGRDAWDEFIYDAVKDYIAEEGVDTTNLPPDHIFFISIESFEKLISVCKGDINKWYEIFSNAVDSNSVGVTKKFTFGLHLEKYQYAPLPFIKSAADTLFAGILKMLQINPPKET